MRMLIRFIKWIPAYFRIHKKWGLYPDHIDWALDNYEKTLYELTGGKLSKVLYSSAFIVETVREHFCENCDRKEDETE